MPFSVEPLNLDGSPGSHLKVTNERFVNLVPATFNKNDVELQARVKRPLGGTFRLYVRYADPGNNYFMEFGPAGIFVRKSQLGFRHVIAAVLDLPNDSLGLVWRFRCKTVLDSIDQVRFEVATAPLLSPTSFVLRIVDAFDHHGPEINAASLLADFGIISKFAIEFEGTDMLVDKVQFYEEVP